MKKYFYSDGKEKHGPLSLEELKHEDISKDTLVWFEGLDDWRPAQDLDDLKPILELKPPPILIADDEKSEIENKDEEPPGKESPDSHNSQTVKKKQFMFSNPFSFEGRIRRTEYGISFIIAFIVSIFLNAIIASGQVPVIGLAYIPIFWFSWAQGAKRCHDMGQSGWFQIIPFYVLWMIFASGESGMNKYGVNPKD